MKCSNTTCIWYKHIIELMKLSRNKKDGINKRIDTILSRCDALKCKNS